MQTTLYHEDSRIAHHNGEYFLKEWGSPSVDIDEPVLSLGSAEPSNYGSWLMRVLPKLAIANELGLEDLPVLCYCPQSWQKELLLACGVKQEKIIPLLPWKSYKLSEVYVPSDSNVGGLFK